MDTGCLRYRALLSAAIDGETSLAEEQALQGHLQECEACQASYDAYRQIRRQLRALPVPAAPVALRAAVLERVPEIAVRGTGRAPVGRARPLLGFGHKLALSMAALAILLAGSLVAVGLLRTPVQPFEVAGQPVADTDEQKIIVAFSRPVDKDYIMANAPQLFSVKDSEGQPVAIDFEHVRVNGERVELPVKQEAARINENENIKVVVNPDIKDQTGAKVANPGQKEVKVVTLSPSSTSTQRPTRTPAPTATRPPAPTSTPRPEPTATAVPATSAPTRTAAPATATATRPPATATAVITAPPARTTAPATTRQPTTAAATTAVPATTSIPATTSRPVTATVAVTPASPSVPAATSAPLTATPTVTVTVTATIAVKPTGALRPDSCDVSVVRGFGKIFNDRGDVASKTGCPTGREAPAMLVYQPFQRGFMVWHKQSGWIYVFYNSGSWARYPEPGPGQVPVLTPGTAASSPAATKTPTNSGQPDCTITPLRGFGIIWAGKPGVRTGLGCPLASENSTLEAAFQPFNRGLMLYNPIALNGRRIYALYLDGSYSDLPDNYKD